MTFTGPKEFRTLSILDGLKEAKALLIRDGWGKGNYVHMTKTDTVSGFKCERCVVGALYQYSPQLEEPTVRVNMGIQDVFLEAANKITPNESTAYSPIGWNDVPGRTFEQVIAAFDLAIQRAEEFKGDDL